MQERGAGRRSGRSFARAAVGGDRVDEVEGVVEADEEGEIGEAEGGVIYVACGAVGFSSGHVQML